jgi:hypothetical protein
MSLSSPDPPSMIEDEPLSVMLSFPALALIVTPVPELVSVSLPLVPLIVVM